MVIKTIKEGNVLLEIKTYQDLCYALKSRKELKESANPKFKELRELIGHQIEKLLE